MNSNSKQSAKQPGLPAAQRRKNRERLQQVKRSLDLRFTPPSSRQLVQQANKATAPGTRQIGAAVASRQTRLGMTDVRSHRIAWVVGQIFVGDGTNGTADSVYLLTANGLSLIKGLSAGTSSGWVPLAPSDSVVGASFVSDIEKHYARKKIRRMWLHIESLQPSTSNSMVAVIAPLRGGSGLVKSFIDAKATAPETANTFVNVSSCKGAITCNSWESKSMDITDYIAGGSGAQQNEFEIGNVNNSSTLYPGGNGSVSGLDGEGLVPAMFCVAGNNATSGLRGTATHQIVCEQEVDLLDYLGGQSQQIPVA